MSLTRVALLWLTGALGTATALGAELVRLQGASAIPIGTLVGERSPLGAGGFSSVEKATIRLPDGSQHVVSLKQYFPKRLAQYQENRGEDPREFPFRESHRAVTSLLTEAPAPHLRGEWGNLLLVADDGKTYAVTLSEFMDGSLSAVAPELRLNPDAANLSARVGEIHRLMLHTAEGMATLQRKGLVHGDIKPENILFRETAEGIREYALADLDGVQRSGTAWRVRTVTNLPPDTPTRRVALVSREADIFALAKALYQTAFGQSPADHFLKNNPVGLARLNAVTASYFRLDPELKPLYEELVAQHGGVNPALDELRERGAAARSNMPDWDARIFSTLLAAQEQAQAELYASRPDYLKMLQAIEKDFATLARSGSLAAEAQQQLDEIRQFLRFGLSRESSARANALRAMRVARDRGPIVRLCPERMRDIQSMMLKRVLGATADAHR